jgi:hypothetical protein
MSLCQRYTWINPQYRQVGLWQCGWQRAALFVQPAEWDICSQVLNYTVYSSNMIPIYNQLVKKYRVLIYSGDVDSCVNYISTEICATVINSVNNSHCSANWSVWKHWTMASLEGWKASGRLQDGSWWQPHIYHNQRGRTHGTFLSFQWQTNRCQLTNLPKHWHFSADSSITNRFNGLVALVVLYYICNGKKCCSTKILNVTGQRFHFISWVGGTQVNGSHRWESKNSCTDSAHQTFFLFEIGSKNSEFVAPWEHMLEVGPRAASVVVSRRSPHRQAHQLNGS